MSHQMITLLEALQMVESRIGAHPIPAEPKGLYDPVRYFLTLGGKRIRPCLSLLSSNLFSDKPEQFVAPAIALEIFHNFSLVHDDIMDAAPLRRGADTVHEKWDLNTAILSGDLMLIDAYQLLSQSPSESLPKVLALFNQTAREVCEGQQMDMDFESGSEVSLQQYLHMIRLKTSVLLGCSLGIGALCGGAKEKQVDLLYHFGENLGMAFQIMDDLLDCFPSEKRFGKQAGGDILRKKKTYLYIQTMELATQADKLALDTTYQSSASDKVEKVLSIFQRYDMATHARKKMDAYFADAMIALQQVKDDGFDTSVLEQLGLSILHRQH